MARRWPFALGALLGVLAVALAFVVGHDRIADWGLAARWTARVGFPVFIVAYSASSLARLWPSELTRGLWRDRRWWGLGFFASHTIHLGALITYLQVSGETRPWSVLIVAGGAYAMLFVMAATSNEPAMRALGRNWKRLHTFGIHYLWFIFFVSYLGRTMEPEKMAQGYAGTMIALAALGLRIAAWAKGRGQRAAAT